MFVLTVFVLTRVYCNNKQEFLNKEIIVRNSLDDFYSEYTVYYIK